MRFDATFPLLNAIWRNSGGFAPALVLILATLLVAIHPARAAGPQAQPPAAKRPGNARPTAKQSTAPNAAVAPTAVPAQSAVQNTAPIAEQVLRQNLIQDPLRVAIDQAVQKGKQEAAANTVAKSPAKTTATQTTPVATGTAPPNAAQNGPDSANPTPSEPPAVNGATNPNESAAATLVCKGTRVNGAAFTFPFAADTSPAPTAGDACVPSGKQIPKGTAVMGTAPKSSTVFAVVFVPPTKAGGANKGAKGPAGAPTGPIPPAISAGIKAMVSSRASLENAGNKWGGHKEPAIKLIDQALKVCGQTATPDSAGTKPNAAGETAAMEAALTQLTAAERDMTNAKNPWGECRDQAKTLISQALSDVQAGIAFAKSHNTK